MAGVYIHIPFCRKACNYCNFHFSTSLKRKEDLIGCLLLELEQRKDFFKTNPNQYEKSKIETIYFGGGTPSVMLTSELLMLLEKIHDVFEVLPNPEITMEANPDDLNINRLKELRKTSINRLSLGIQSFHQDDLDYLNRIHSSVQAKKVVDNCLSVGFRNLTLDLIFGIPTLTDKKWLENLDYVIERKIPHISVYGLTVEPKTPLELFIRKGKVQPVDEEQYSRQFEIMVDRLESAGYEHYEISNFALPGMESQHNTSYWTGKPYLGLGPSAHSFKANQRWWNIANTSKYIETIKSGHLAIETEVLSSSDSYNEYIMTSLRTSKGCNYQEIMDRWGEKQVQDFMMKMEVFEKKGYISFNEGGMTLTKRGKLLADGITSEFFIG